MDRFNLGKDRGPRYETVAGAQKNNGFESVVTEYPSPEFTMTPEADQGFFQYSDDRNSPTYPERPALAAGARKESSGEKVIKKIRSRFSSFRDSEFGKSKGRPQNYKSWFFFWSGIFMALLWCAPAISLLVLNLTNYVVGASAFCPTGDCPGIAVNTNQSLAQLTSKADHVSHNFIGALQFTAKAMEVWFMYIAVSLVYVVTAWIARSKHGLPIGYLLTYIEFTDILYILKPSHWTSAHLVDNSDPYKKERRVKKFYVFAVAVALLCVLANLIGPAVAVLMIPTVQWVPTTSTYPKRFTSMLSANEPTTFPFCNASSLADKQWNCTSGTYDFALDSVAEFVYSQVTQDYLSDGNLGNYGSPTLQELALSFEFNVTAVNSSDTSAVSYWAPNRQVIRDLSQDQEDYFDTIHDPNSPYAGFQNSITLNLQRQGPIVQVEQLFTYANVTVTKVDNEREIHCYSFWSCSIAENTCYAKCFRAGTGWNSSSTISTFNVGTVASGRPEDNYTMPVVTRSFFSDRSAFIANDINTGNITDPCFPNGTVSSTANCNYEKIFTDPIPKSIPANYSAVTNAFIVENYVMNDTSLSFISENYLGVGFSTYAVDVTNETSSSSFGVVQINALPITTTPVVMDSSWFQAAWSVNNGEDVSWLRFSPRKLQLTIQNLYRQVSRSPWEIDMTMYDQVFWSQLNSYSLLEAASLLPYNYTDPASDGLKTAFDDAQHPQLAKNANRQVYAFGIDSRTSIVGVVVTSLGCVIAVARAVVGVWSRIRHREPIEILVSAMKHESRAEFEGIEHSETKIAKVRFGIHDNTHDQLLFHKK